MNKFIGNDTPLLTMGQVQQKRAERAAKARERDALDHDIAVLDRWLEAAAFLSGAPVSENEIAVGEIMDIVDDTENMADATKRILTASTKALSYRQLRMELGKTALFDERLNKNPNYFYTMVSRLVKRGEVVRHRKLLRMRDKESAGS